MQFVSDDKRCTVLLRDLLELHADYQSVAFEAEGFALGGIFVSYATISSVDILSDTLFITLKNGVKWWFSLCSEAHGMQLGSGDL